MVVSGEVRAWSKVAGIPVLYVGGLRTRSVGVWARRGPPDDRQDRP